MSKKEETKLIAFRIKKSRYDYIKSIADEMDVSLSEFVRKIIDVSIIELIKENKELFKGL